MSEAVRKYTRRWLPSGFGLCVLLYSSLSSACGADTVPVLWLCLRHPNCLNLASLTSGQVAGASRSVQADTFADFWDWTKFELVAAVLHTPHALTVLTLPLLVLTVLLLLC